MTLIAETLTSHGAAEAPSVWPKETPPSDSELREIFAPVFATIAEGAIRRDQERELPFAAVKLLRDVRFGALRVPIDHGGYGASVKQFLQLLIQLAQADPNVAHIYRGHAAVVEEKLAEPDSETRSLWLRRFAQGDIVGNAMTEPGNVALGKQQTLFSPGAGDDSESWTVSGTKFYSTGTIFAEWSDVSGSREGDHEWISGLVRVNQAGIEISDDWDGFGQRLTGTGTTRFSSAVVEGHAIQERTGRVAYLTAVFQTVLLATTAGVALSLVSETAEHVRKRTRVYGHGNADLAREDAQIQQVVGEVASAAYASEALVLALAPAFEKALEITRAEGPASAHDTVVELDLAVFKTQVVLADLVLGASTKLFNALSSSAVRLGAGLDRHWRNARTILSHNPVIYRARVVGDYEVNGTIPEKSLGIGVAESTLQTQRPTLNADTQEAQS